MATTAAMDSPTSSPPAANYSLPRFSTAPTHPAPSHRASLSHPPSHHHHHHPPRRASEPAAPRRRPSGAYQPDDDDYVGPPRIGFEFGRKQHWSIAYMIAGLLVTSMLLPLAVFYGVKFGVPDIGERELLGGVTAAFGTLEACLFPLRWLKLIYWCRHPVLNRAPRRGWGAAFYADTVQWMFAFAITIFASLFTIASIIPSYPLFLMVPPILITSLSLPVLLSVPLSSFSLKSPYQLSSIPAHSPIRPLTYYIFEDVLAVDGGGALASRRRSNTRYTSSPRFRSMMRDAALFAGTWGSITVGLGFAIVGPLVIVAPSEGGQRERRVDAALPTVLVTTALWVGLGAAVVGRFVVGRVRKERALWAVEHGLVRPPVGKEETVVVQEPTTEAGLEMEERGKALEPVLERERPQAGDGGAVGVGQGERPTTAYSTDDEATRVGSVVGVSVDKEKEKEIKEERVKSADE